jgi:hypothetical protein
MVELLIRPCRGERSSQLTIGLYNFCNRTAYTASSAPLPRRLTPISGLAMAKIDDLGGRD